EPRGRSAHPFRWCGAENSTRRTNRVKLACRLAPWHRAATSGKDRETCLGPWSTKEGMVYSHAPKEALEQVLALRIHLDDSTSVNGPLRVLPSTHGGGVFADFEIQERSSTSQCAECTVATGGVIA